MKRGLVGWAGGTQPFKIGNTPRFFIVKRFLPSTENTYKLKKVQKKAIFLPLYHLYMEI